MSDESQQPEPDRSGNARPAVTVIILAAVLAALGAFLVRRAL